MAIRQSTVLTGLTPERLYDPTVDTMHALYLLRNTGSETVYMGVADDVDASTGTPIHAGELIVMPVVAPNWVPWFVSSAASSIHVLWGS